MIVWRGMDFSSFVTEFLLSGLVIMRFNCNCWFPFQGDESLSKQLSAKPSAEKVKVLTAGSASLPRIPLEEEPQMTLSMMNQRRDYAQYILSQRLDDIATRHRNDLRNLYIPYVENA